ncbi:hypothetical protein [Paenibacillus apiarius]|uniref:Uncharacterized protein n=1 Tax=Paenibacillus apiarius TaxID=46240 RepID=A0ABT4E114_9BACL|nr:hypothetical protein [Paenibacillus apiarius]MCY9517000.1 hypothetical protein [Paenibacillus apiarius]MCY9523292.1 hypothetical protein [Paenibacillus apiarius]MCY9554210.1 hypothetical protein [Paenibacillus apiarius]MCY9560821.1 hypothetical protein [Paenibacillus apiarius]MCY9682743.1 hypothetical protein [Paenibacillus apiarius]
MVRKSISLCIALCLSIALILPVGGQASASGALSTDTIVTEENVNQVIEYLGLDPRDLKKAEADAFSDDSVTVTVGELQQALNQLKQLPKEVTSTETANAIAPLASSDFCTGLQMLYYTTNLGGSFELSYEVSANYSWNKFTAVNNATVSVIDNDDNLLTTFTIASKDVGAKVIDDGKKVEMKAKVKVDSWISVGNIGLIKVTTTTVNTTKEWTTTSIPGCI